MKLLKDRYRIVLILIFLLIVFLMLPFREQSFGDDFAYAQSVRHFLTTGEVFVTEWSSAALIFPIFWGALFSKLFGFSFSILQLSVLPFLLMAVLATYQILVLLKVGRLRAFVFALLVLGNPWFIEYAYSFMTDIIYIGLGLTGAVFAVRSLAKDSRIAVNSFLAGSFFGLALLARQHAVAFALPFMLVCVVRKDFKKLIWFSAPFFAIFLSYMAWYSLGHHAAQAQIYVFNHQAIFSVNTIYHPFDFVIEMVHRLVFYLAGVFGLMVFTPLFFKFNSAKLRKFVLNYKFYILLGLLVLFLLTVVDFFFRRSEFVLGIPWELFSYDSFYIPWAHLWKFMVAASFIFAVLWAVYSMAKTKTISGPMLFVLLALLAHFGFTLNSCFLWGSYNIPLIPLVLITVAFTTQDLALSKSRATIVCAFMLVLSFELAKTRYDLNGILWQKATAMVSNGMPPYAVEFGNYAWKPWFYFENRVQQAIAKAGGKEKMDYMSPFNDGYPPPKYYLIWDKEPVVKGLTLMESTPVKFFLRKRNLNFYQDVQP